MYQMQVHVDRRLDGDSSSDGEPRRRRNRRWRREEDGHEGGGHGERRREEAVMKQVFECHHYTEEKKVKVATLEFKEYAMAQGKLNNRHAKWVEFLEEFPYVVKNKIGKANIMVDALSLRHDLIATLEIKLMGLECVKGLYEHNPDFAYPMPIKCMISAHETYFRHEGFLFKDKRLCVPKGSVMELV
ncbi:PREDICTED: uncharacterized protein LOC109356166 [Lupinus angustifolius]|uniref:uncharacterized protein LOC109356166 n=1 Tax=Lupinus angustifolius TaxID=3871 RepID=UPI00092F40F5|nr:PREDICTED: uncharacterized protein LOC109356166 [Lupinus angustifolius]